METQRTLRRDLAATRRKAGGPVSSPNVAASDPFSEWTTWRSIGSGWRPLFGRFHECGFSFEWHDFALTAPLAWSQSFHPGSIELCLNLSGAAQLAQGSSQIELGPQTYAFYYQGTPGLSATRKLGAPHRFITVEFSAAFLREHLSAQAEHLHPLIQRIVRGDSVGSAVAPPARITASLHQLVQGLRHCPAFAPAHLIWFRSKALELAAQVFFQPASGELFCTRTQRAAFDRIEKTRVILSERAAEPPSLEELGRMVGCSASYLSRIFSQETGQTIQQYLRQIRLERAAQLLRTGQCNVTEAALEVGYNSLSHFSMAFHEMFGCCPGLYPLATTTQRKTSSPDSD